MGYVRIVVLKCYANSSLVATEKALMAESAGILGRPGHWYFWKSQSGLDLGRNSREED